VRVEMPSPAAHRVTGKHAEVPAAETGRR
jgi:hypothetical protein